MVFCGLLYLLELYPLQLLCGPAESIVSCSFHLAFYNITVYIKCCGDFKAFRLKFGGLGQQRVHLKAGSETWTVASCRWIRGSELNSQIEEVGSSRLMTDFIIKEALCKGFKR